MGGSSVKGKKYARDADESKSEGSSGKAGTKLCVGRESAKWAKVRLGHPGTKVREGRVGRESA
ncbi:hypothetical protein KI387_021202 [Taxus chinensis]|uniref:Uncharacterized protein n=1 Tax=Taxus chinensis TaxID=29808 RepID=A0AA38GCN7_TAXCH|nr:hypothetical protein KI387_021202 [Taxus chinensis]